MQREMFNRFLSCLMGYSWQVHRTGKRTSGSGIKKKDRSFADALRHSWKVSREELSGRALPLVTSGWNF
ncbi:hypothetical protein V9K67_21535 [Paraflavisolibacter sp. H34]|uniref:hypothetical protein n=1 Tax=Huijunlia imazamoxiresistens TaxID=3127457 RepID=UPI00301B40D7